MKTLYMGKELAISCNNSVEFDNLIKYLFSENYTLPQGVDKLEYKRNHYVLINYQQKDLLYLLTKPNGRDIMESRVFIERYKKNSELELALELAREIIYKD